MGLLLIPTLIAKLKNKGFCLKTDDSHFIDLYIILPMISKNLKFSDKFNKKKQRKN